MEYLEQRTLLAGAEEMTPITEPTNPVSDVCLIENTFALNHSKGTYCEETQIEGLSCGELTHEIIAASKPYAKTALNGTGTIFDTSASICNHTSVATGYIGNALKATGTFINDWMASPIINIGSTIESFVIQPDFKDFKGQQLIDAIDLYPDEWEKACSKQYYGAGEAYEDVLSQSIYTIGNIIKGLGATIMFTGETINCMGKASNLVSSGTSWSAEHLGNTGSWIHTQANTKL